MNSVDQKTGTLTVAGKKYDLKHYGELMYIQPEDPRRNLVVELRTFNGGMVATDDNGVPYPNPAILPITAQDEADRLQNECNAFWRVHGRA